jgi:hypothetical protein
MNRFILSFIYVFTFVIFIITTNNTLQSLSLQQFSQVVFNIITADFFISITKDLLKKIERQGDKK